MAKERARKKSFQQSLEDIKERMKEKRNKRLASASAPSRGRSRMINKKSGTNSTHTILKGVQLNNKALAVALQAEKEKVRQANAVILQLKREQQALFLHLLLLKRKLKEQEALAASASEVHCQLRKRTSQNLDEHILCETSPICPPKKSEDLQCEKHLTLPSTVGVRRQRTDKNRRRTERFREQRILSEEGPNAGFGAWIPSPICSDSENQNQLQKGQQPEMADPGFTEELQHSTPEPLQPKKSRQQPSRKQAQQQSSKPEQALRKPEGGRKPERAPLKKPWENTKPRARSKSRDRSATRAKAAPPAQGNKLNNSLGFNDTFDFDCEETVHVTPFRAKAEDNRPALSEEAQETGQAQTEASPMVSKQSESSSLSPSSESEDSLYVPHKTRRRLPSPEKTKVVTTRRGRPSKVFRQTENVPPKREISVFRDEVASPKTTGSEDTASRLNQSPDSSFSNSPDPVKMEHENYQEPRGEGMENDCLLPVSPLVEAEMMRIDNVLSNFGDSSSEAPPHLPHPTPQRLKSCKKRGLGVRTAGRGLSLCDVTNLSPAAYRCSTPVPIRKRRCTMVVDYKEPSLHAKLRRGDKFTDVQFLRSPVFKQKSGRRSVQKPRNSKGGQQPFEKYNEPFFGCR
uniref:Shugoshin 1 n=1 Tax=Amphilophus citrinellus TaxID=61819 RepID=A0A3Q0SL27_AMPCI